MHIQHVTLEGNHVETVDGIAPSIVLACDESVDIPPAPRCCWPHSAQHFWDWVDHVFETV